MPRVVCWRENNLKFAFLDKKLSNEEVLFTEIPPSYAGKWFTISYELLFKAKHSAAISETAKITVPITLLDRTHLDSASQRAFVARQTNGFDVLDFVHPRE